MSATNFHSEARHRAESRLGPAALVIAPPASPLESSVGAVRIARSSISHRTLTRASRFSRNQRAKIAPPTLSQFCRGEGAEGGGGGSRADLIDWGGVRGILTKLRGLLSDIANLAPIFRSRFDSTSFRLSGFALSRGKTRERKAPPASLLEGESFESENLRDSSIHVRSWVHSPRWKLRGKLCGIEARQSKARRPGNSHRLVAVVLAVMLLALRPAFASSAGRRCVLHAIERRVTLAKNVGEAYVAVYIQKPWNNFSGSNANGELPARGNQFQRRVGHCNRQWMRWIGSDAVCHEVCIGHFIEGVVTRKWFRIAIGSRVYFDGLCGSLAGVHDRHVERGIGFGRKPMRRSEAAGMHASGAIGYNRSDTQVGTHTFARHFRLFIGSPPTAKGEQNQKTAEERVCLLQRTPVLPGSSSHWLGGGLLALATEVPRWCDLIGMMLLRGFASGAPWSFSTHGRGSL